MAEESSSRGGDAPGDCPSNFVERIGAALIAPRSALRHTSDRAGTDLALLLLVAFVAIHTREAVAAGWLVAVDSLSSGAVAIASALSRAVSMKLIFLFGAGSFIWLGAGSRRSFARNFDHAAVALVPVVFVDLVATLIARGVYTAPPEWLKDGAAIAAYGWGAAVAVAAVIVSREPVEATE